MYCTKCFKQDKKQTAEYIFKGNSICAEHLSQKLTPKQKQNQVTPIITNNNNRRAKVKLQSKP